LQGLASEIVGCPEARGTRKGSVLAADLLSKAGCGRSVSCACNPMNLVRMFGGAHVSRSVLIVFPVALK
jgi:hypothetical protein